MKTLIKTTRSALLLAGLLCATASDLVGQPWQSLFWSTDTTGFVRSYDYPLLPSRSYADTTNWPQDWITARSFEAAMVSSSGRVAEVFLQLYPDNTFIQGVRGGGLSRPFLEAQAGWYAVDTVNHQITLHYVRAVTMKNYIDSTERPHFGPIRGESSRTFAIEYYYREHRAPERPEWNFPTLKREESLILNDIMKQGAQKQERDKNWREEDSGQLCYLRGINYPRGPYAPYLEAVTRAALKLSQPPSE